MYIAETNSDLGPDCDLSQPVSSGSTSPSKLKIGGTSSKFHRICKGMPPLRLLVVEDDEPLRNVCCAIALQMGFVLLSAGSVLEAQDALKNYPVDMLLLDLKLPGGSGLKLIGEVKKQYPQIAVVVMTGYATVPSAVEAMRTGAVNYLTKPFAREDLSAALWESSQQLQFDADSRSLRKQLQTPRGIGNIVGTSPVMEKIYRMLGRVAHSSYPVLISGESGTGKELVAKTIHDNGPTAAEPFFPIACTSPVPTLLATELFGYVEETLRGATRFKDGLLVSAQQGTVFLDEVGELRLDLQAKLLHALQRKEVRSAGGTDSSPISARVISATSRNLEEMVAQGSFRKDLYSLLSLVNLKIPPIRQRTGDIPILTRHFLEQIQQKSRKSYRLSREAATLIAEYDWPGNVRELQHAIERSCAVCSSHVLHAVDLPAELHAFRAQRLEAELLAADQITDGGNIAGELVASMAKMEKQAILGTIQRLNGDKVLAAKLLGIGKTTLYRKLKEYGRDDQVETEDD